MLFSKNIFIELLLLSRTVFHGGRGGTVTVQYGTSQFCPKNRPVNRCGLFLINPARGVERIPGRDMQEKPGATRALLNSTFGERLEELRGVGPMGKLKRGKKIKVAPVQS